MDTLITFQQDQDLWTPSVSPLGTKEINHGCTAWGGGVIYRSHRLLSMGLLVTFT